jgi:hypothetical protein
VTLATSSPGLPASLPAGSQLCMKRSFGKMGACVSFIATDGPVGDRSTNADRWISGVGSYAPMRPRSVFEWLEVRQQEVTLAGEHRWHLEGLAQ